MRFRCSICGAEYNELPYRGCTTPGCNNTDILKFSLIEGSEAPAPSVPETPEPYAPASSGSFIIDDPDPSNSFIIDDPDPSNSFTIDDPDPSNSFTIDDPDPSNSFTIDDPDPSNSFTIDDPTPSGSFDDPDFFGEEAPDLDFTDGPEADLSFSEPQQEPWQQSQEQPWQSQEQSWQPQEQSWQQSQEQPWQQSQEQPWQSQEQSWQPQEQSWQQPQEQSWQQSQEQPWQQPAPPQYQQPQAAYSQQIENDYRAAKKHMKNSPNPIELNEAIRIFRSLNGYKDSEALARKCEETLSNGGSSGNGRVITIIVVIVVIALLAGAGYLVYRLVSDSMKSEDGGGAVAATETAVYSEPATEPRTEPRTEPSTIPAADPDFPYFGIFETGPAADALKETVVYLDNSEIALLEDYELYIWDDGKEYTRTDEDLFGESLCASWDLDTEMYHSDFPDYITLEGIKVTPGKDTLADLLKNGCKYDTGGPKFEKDFNSEQIVELLYKDKIFSVTIEPTSNHADDPEKSKILGVSVKSGSDYPSFEYMTLGNADEDLESVLQKLGIMPNEIYATGSEKGGGMINLYYYLNDDYSVEVVIKYDSGVSSLYDISIVYDD